MACTLATPMTHASNHARHALFLITGIAAGLILASLLLLALGAPVGLSHTAAILIGVIVLGTYAVGGGVVGFITAELVPHELA